MFFLISIPIPDYDEFCMIFANDNKNQMHQICSVDLVKQ